MDTPAFYACLLLALFIIVLRGPLIFAPEATLVFYMSKILPSPTRMRVLGVAMLIVALALVATTLQRTDETLPVIIFLLGVLLAAGSLVLLGAPAFAGRLVAATLSWFGPIMLRIVGIVSVAIALLLVYLAYVYL